jgi:hypothetical protein
MGHLQPVQRGVVEEVQSRNVEFAASHASYLNSLNWICNLVPTLPLPCTNHLDITYYTYQSICCHRVAESNRPSHVASRRIDADRMLD